MATTSQQACAPPVISTSSAIPLESLMRLRGTFRFVTVITARGYDSSPFTSELKLRAADTLERFYERQLRGLVRVGDKPLVGELSWRLEDGKRGNTRVAVKRVDQDAQLISGYCESCLDATWTYYRISEVRPDGFSGTWQDPQTGLGKLVDKNGQRLPDPEGYYCAYRIR